MKKIILPITLTLLLSGCSFFNSSSSTSKSSSTRTILPTEEPPIGHSYDEVADKLIEWNNLFEQASELYYVYFYSPTCGHCSDFKNTIIEYALNTDKDFYFCKESMDFVYTEDNSTSVGATSLDGFAIEGFPGLAVFNQHKVTVCVSGTGKIANILSI